MRSALLVGALGASLGGCLLVTVPPSPPPLPPVAQHHGLPPAVVYSVLPPASATVQAPQATVVPVTPLVPQTGTVSLVEPVPVPSGRPEVLPLGLGLGRPPRFAPDAQAGYWLWQGPRGDWLLRTTSSGESHAFSGTLAGTSGPVTVVSPTSAALADRIQQSDGVWRFSFSTAGHADGFTFVVQGGGCARLDLRLDGAPASPHIFVGSGQLQPRSSHFVVCPGGRAP